MSLRNIKNLKYIFLAILTLSFFACDLDSELPKITLTVV